MDHNKSLDNRDILGQYFTQKFKETFVCFSPAKGLSSADFHDTYDLLCSRVKPPINMESMMVIVKGVEKGRGKERQSNPQQSLCQRL